MKSNGNPHFNTNSDLFAPNKVDFNSFQQNCVRLLSPDCTVNSTTQLINGTLGLSGESGEVADLAKKHLFHGHPLDKEKIKLELGDILFYVSSTADALGFTLQEVAEGNVTKLGKRYPNGFSVEDSKIKRDQDENN